MNANTVLIDLNEVKVGFWDRLRKLARDDETSASEFLIEMRGQMTIIDELESAGDIHGRQENV